MEIDLNRVIEVRRQAEYNKQILGIRNKSYTPDKSLPLIGSWREVEMPIEAINNLVMFASSDVLSGLHAMYRHLGPCLVGDVVKAMPELQRMNDPRIKQWLSTMDERLPKALLAGDYPPLILLSQPQLRNGSISDGVHRALTFGKLANDGTKLEVKAIIGDSNPFLWLSYLLYSVARGRDFTLSDRAKLASHRISQYQRSTKMLGQYR